MYPFCTPKRGIQGFSPSNLFYKFHFSLKSCDIPKFMCEIPGKYLIFGENTDKFRSIYAVKTCPSLFASFMPLLGYNVRGYMKFTMLLHVFSNVPPHSILFWGTRIKGTFFPLSEDCPVNFDLWVFDSYKTKRQFVQRTLNTTIKINIEYQTLP